MAMRAKQSCTHQIKCVTGAVKQGSATFGIKSRTHVVLVALNEGDKLSPYQKKIFLIDDHVAISITELTLDGRVLSKYMKTECLHSRYVYDRPLPVSKLVLAVGKKMQLMYGRRPYDVEMLVAGYDDEGEHLYQICPSNVLNVDECKAMSVGAHSQSARTYLEKNLDQFADSSLDELVRHALQALREYLPSEAELTAKNVTIAVVGEGKVEINEDEKVQRFLDIMETTKGGRSAQAAGAEGEEGGSMDQDQPAAGDDTPQQPAQEQPMDQDS